MCFIVVVFTNFTPPPHPRPINSYPYDDTKNHINDWVAAILQRFDLWRERSISEEEENFADEGNKDEVVKDVDGASCETSSTQDADDDTADVSNSRQKDLVPRKKRVKKKQREEKKEWRRWKRKSSKRRKEIETEYETDGDMEEAEEENQDIELTQVKKKKKAKKATHRDEGNQ